MSLSNQPNAPVHSKRAPPHNTFAVMLQRAFVILLCLCGIVGLLFLDRSIGSNTTLPVMKAGVSYGLLLLAGFFTSIHCVGMCGPLVFGYALKAAGRSAHSHLDHILYGIGKTLSYSAIGALFGGLGAAVTFTPMLRGVAGMVAGCFVLLFGLSLLNVFSGLERFHLHTPTAIMRFIRNALKTHHHPFAVGLLNGLMIICGPLQAMYILAAGSGSMVEGARMLFIFGAGTLPLMLGFGFLTTSMSARLAPKIIHASGFIVMALGVVMLNRGLAMTGTGYDFDALVARISSASAIPSHTISASEQIIRTDVKSSAFSPNEFVLHQGVPVKWVINAEELNQCNKKIVVPSYGLEISLHPGENVVTFVPSEGGVTSWSCWMGMMPGRFVVQEATLPAGGADAAALDNDDMEPKWIERLKRFGEFIKRRIDRFIDWLKRFAT
jgi:sulfite exporter TauE/SafE